MVKLANNKDRYSYRSINHNQSCYLLNLFFLITNKLVSDKTLIEAIATIAIKELLLLLKVKLAQQ